jgi:predicted 2-oxoglutarate/Fe(II)-dependent dioxygenase YbiX
LQLLRYEEGGHFRPHRDRGGSIPNAVFTIVGGLCHPQCGGELVVLEPNPVQFSLTPGMIVAFPAEALHESLTVEVGTKIAFVCWVLGASTS